MNGSTEYRVTLSTLYKVTVWHRICLRYDYQPSDWCSSVWSYMGYTCIWLHWFWFVWNWNFQVSNFMYGDKVFGLEYHMINKQVSDSDSDSDSHAADSDFKMIRE